MKRTFIIAEIGQAHDGSLGILHSYIDAVADAGVDAVKFQTHIAEAESSLSEPFRVNFSYEDSSRLEYWRRMEFTIDQWVEIKKHCDQVGLEFLSSPFSNAAVDLLEKIGVLKYKIGSGETSNLLLLEKIAKSNKEIILSSGMSTYAELDQTINFLNTFNSKVAILQCTTKYPTGPKDVGLNVLSQLKLRYNCSVGLSDHSGTIFPSLAAVSLGATIIEVHVTFDKRMFGPDTSSSLTIDDLDYLVRGIRFLDESMSHPIDKDNFIDFSDQKRIFGKSLAINKRLLAGHVIEFGDLEAKKPMGKGIEAKDFREFLGRELKRDMNKWDFLNEEDFL